jgi:transmembrane sensor
VITLNKDVILEEARYWLSSEQEGMNLTSNQKFLSWISISSEHKKIYDDEKEFRSSIMNLSKQYKQNAVNQVKKELKTEQTYSKKLAILLPLAACILIVCYLTLFSKTEITYTNNIATNNKILKNILLPDKSQITLDAQTSLDIIYTNNTREVLLNKGKAIFNVSSNKQVPFYVKSNGILVQVVGTKFEVIKQSEKVNISVLEGIVNIRKGTVSNSKILARLRKGDILNISKRGIINKLEKKPIEKIALWKNEKLVFQQTPLKQVLNEFQKYLTPKIKLNITSNEKYPITGTFGIYEFEKFLTLIPLIYPIKIERKDEKMITLKSS